MSFSVKYAGLVSIALLVVISSLVVPSLAVHDTVSTFWDGSTSVNLTFNEPDNKTVYFTLPRKANVTDIGLSMTGMAIAEDIFFSSIDYVPSEGDILSQDGYVWYGTTGGLVRYNQVLKSKAVFTTTEGLSHNVVNALTRQESSIYVGTLKGISVYDLSAGRFTGEILAPGLNVQALIAFGDVVYIGTSTAGVLRYDAVSSSFLTPLNSSNGLVGDDVKSLSLWHDVLIIGTSSSGVSRFNVTSGSFLADITYTPPLMTSNSVNVVRARNDSEILLLGTQENGIVRFNQSVPFCYSTVNVSCFLPQINTSSGLPGNFITALLFQSNDSYIIGVQELGVYFYNSTSGLFYKNLTESAGTLSSDHVRSLGTDGETIFTGTEKGGLSRYNTTSSTAGLSIVTQNGPSSNAIRSLAAAGNDSWFFGTRADDFYQGGVSVFGLQNARFNDSLNTSGGLGSDNVNGVSAALNDSILLIGTDAGFSVYNLASRQYLANLNSSNGLPNNNVFAARAYRDSLFVLGTSAGAARVYANNFSVVTPNLFSGLVRDVLVWDDLFLFATTSGVRRFNQSSNATLPSINTSSGIPSNIVWTLMRDGELLLIGTSAGVAAYNFSQGRVIALFNSTTGLSENKVPAMAAGHASYFFGTAGGGITEYDRTTGLVRNYFNTSNGLSHDSVNALFVFENSTLLIGTDGGVSRLNLSTGTFLHQSQYYNYPTAVSVDTGSDGFIDYNSSDVLNGSRWLTTGEINTTAINVSLSQCPQAQAWCNVSLRVSSATDGIIIISNISANYTLEPDIVTTPLPSTVVRTDTLNVSVNVSSNTADLSDLSIGLVLPPEVVIAGGESPVVYVGTLLNRSSNVSVWNVSAEVVGAFNLSANITSIEYNLSGNPSELVVLPFISTNRTSSDYVRLNESFNITSAAFANADTGGVSAQLVIPENSTLDAGGSPELVNVGDLSRYETETIEWIPRINSTGNYSFTIEWNGTYHGETDSYSQQFNVTCVNDTQPPQILNDSFASPHSFFVDDNDGVGFFVNVSDDVRVRSVRLRLLHPDGNVSNHSLALVSGNGTYGLWSVNFSRGFIQLGGRYKVTEISSEDVVTTPASIDTTGNQDTSFEAFFRANLSLDNSSHYAGERMLVWGNVLRNQSSPIDSNCTVNVSMTLEDAFINSTSANVSAGSLASSFYNVSLVIPSGTFARNYSLNVSASCIYGGRALNSTTIFVLPVPRVNASASRPFFLATQNASISGWIYLSNGTPLEGSLNVSYLYYQNLSLILSEAASSNASGFFNHSHKFSDDFEGEVLANVSVSYSGMSSSNTTAFVITSFPEINVTFPPSGRSFSTGDDLVFNGSLHYHNGSAITDTNVTVCLAYPNATCIFCDNATTNVSGIFDISGGMVPPIAGNYSFNASAYDFALDAFATPVDSWFLVRVPLINVTSASPSFRANGNSSIYGHAFFSDGAPIASGVINVSYYYPNLSLISTASVISNASGFFSHSNKFPDDFEGEVVVNVSISNSGWTSRNATAFNVTSFPEITFSVLNSFPTAGLTPQVNVSGALKYHNGTPINSSAPVRVSYYLPDSTFFSDDNVSVNESGIFASALYLGNNTAGGNWTVMADANVSQIDFVASAGDWFFLAVPMVSISADPTYINLGNVTRVLGAVFYYNITTSPIPNASVNVSFIEGNSTLLELYVNSSVSDGTFDVGNWTPPTFGTFRIQANSSVNNISVGSSVSVTVYRPRAQESGGGGGMGGSLAHRRMHYNATTILESTVLAIDLFEGVDGAENTGILFSPGMMPDVSGTRDGINASSQSLTVVREVVLFSAFNATVRLNVTNVGVDTLRDVVIVDGIPAGVKLLTLGIVNASPQFSYFFQDENKLAWVFVEIQPNETIHISYTLQADSNSSESLSMAEFLSPGIIPLKFLQGATPQAGNESAPPQSIPVCGDGICSTGESCGNCPSDCGKCSVGFTVQCGDGNCSGGFEDCTLCPADCGKCPATGVSIVSGGIIAAIMREKAVGWLAAFAVASAAVIAFTFALFLLFSAFPNYRRNYDSCREEFAHAKAFISVVKERKEARFYKIVIAWLLVSFGFYRASRAFIEKGLKERIQASDVISRVSSYDSRLSSRILPAFHAMLRFRTRPGNVQ